METALDIGEFAFVHRQRGYPAVPAYSTSLTDHGLKVECWSNINHYPASKKYRTAEYQCLREYDVYLPFSIQLTIHYPHNGKLIIFRTFCPISSRHTRCFTTISRNFLLKESISDIYAFTSHLHDLECSIPKSPKFFGADRASLDYRRLLNHMGIHTSFI